MTEDGATLGAAKIGAEPRSLALIEGPVLAYGKAGVSTLGAPFAVDGGSDGTMGTPG